MASMQALRQLRPYQERIVNAVGRSNAIVKMPNGSGKTIVAAKLTNENLEHGDASSRSAALFLVPTRDLVDQQSVVMQEWCGANTTVFLFTGDLADPPLEVATGKRCIVSTPKAFLSLQNRKPEAFGWQAFSLVVFDEVHHVLKDHPYRHIALGLKHWQSSSEHSRRQIQIVGLSASLAYGVGDNTIRNTLNRLCRELQIERMESPSMEELIKGGYVPQHGRNVETERVSEAPEGVIPTAERKPHLMHRTFMDRIAHSTATPVALKVWEVIKHLENAVARADTSFRSPLVKAKLVSWEDYVHKRALQSRRNTPTLHLLENWYIALRLLVQSWEEDEVLAMLWLKMNNAYEIAQCPECDEIREMAENPDNAFKLDRLRFHLVQKREMKGPSFRCILFVQQRITAVIISHFINNHPDMGRLGLHAGFVAARESKITPNIKMTKAMVKNTVDDFRCDDSRLNVIVATSVIEEGFDVPAANVVISYDHMKDSVELCQRVGRARHHDSSIVILDERPDRPVSLLESARQLQDTIVQEYTPGSLQQVDEEAERQKQHNRERNGFQSVLRHRQQVYADPVSCLNLYVKKTKSHLLEEFVSERNGSGSFNFSLTYRSILRTIKVDSSGGSTKKTAKKKCALDLLEILTRDTSGS